MLLGPPGVGGPLKERVRKTGKIRAYPFVWDEPVLMGHDPFPYV